MQVFCLSFYSLTCRPGEDIETYVNIEACSVKRRSKTVTKLSVVAVMEEGLNPDQTTDCHKVSEAAAGGVCTSFYKARS